VVDFGGGFSSWLVYKYHLFPKSLLGGRGRGRERKKRREVESGERTSCWVFLLIRALIPF
jgi:hypothetical protein